jgi:signal transduction histidine kinase
VFASLAVVTAGALSLFSYVTVRSALSTEFDRRLENVASAIASQVSPDDIADAALFGEDGAGYANLFVLLEELRATTRVAHASVLDPDRLSLYDDRGAEFLREPSRLDTVASAAVARALAGQATVSGTFVVDGAQRHAAIAPVMDGAVVVALVAVEAPVDYLSRLAGLRRTLLLTTLVITLAISVLAFLFVRGTLASAQLERRLSRAENLAAMGRLTATLAHEIKNPLAIIRGSAQRLGKLEPEAERMAAFVVEESDRLSKTVARYLRFAREAESAASGGTPSGGEIGDLRGMLDRTLDLLEGEMASRKVRLDRTSSAAVQAPVPLDNESLKQVFLNLMLNALEAMPEGGTLSVDVTESSGRYRATVSDTGAGIDPEIIRRLGNPFFTTKAQGTGLGLFLTRRLLTSAGGDLEIESRRGEGTRCVVSLPKRRI